MERLGSSNFDGEGRGLGEREGSESSLAATRWATLRDLRLRFALLRMTVRFVRDESARRKHPRDQTQFV